MDNKPTILGKSGLLWSDPIQDKTPLYDQLMQTYSWTQQVGEQLGVCNRFRYHEFFNFCVKLQLKSQAKTASLCLKRKLSLDVNEIALKKPVKEDVLVSQRYVCFLYYFCIDNFSLLFSYFTAHLRHLLIN